ncbi:MULTISPECIES: nitroreductase family deazaflavin-dependent oxidoreductase [Streptomyces]|uniref:nitroreductase family deazaflavin-dependent oxidoreductase n=1 Tax=Streptomyces TaxID=1883 RepID=UPI001B3812CE|nr:MULTISPECIES: nitroreductase family deazaflavin-dependent oxidoreductase [unclassified Streptomyces]MBQ1110829.1 nitroreductase family deazaflavin-dependent oxidoreductase [Streptomyces sp. 404i]MDQ0700589.1 deazaflavin-dependent oxidoreductase (nitroreductase family) [Streptomyces sp. W4I9-2]
MTSQQHARRSRPPLPRGWRRRLARLPIALYGVGLGPVFGRRLLLLHHTGRNSGLDRRVALEVVAHDRAEGTWILASGFGPEAAWYRNLRASPKTTIQVGNRHYAVTAHFPSADEGGEIMARYAPAHPRTARRLCAFMGFDVDGSADSYRRAGRRIPFVRLEAAPGQRVR